MYLVAIAWIYVVLMMAVAEATSSQGSVLGALVTFLLYGVLPLGIVLYVMGAPGRGKARRAAEAQAAADLAGSPVSAHEEAIAPAGKNGAAGSPPPPSDIDPDGGRLTAGDAVAPERKEP